MMVFADVRVFEGQFISYYFVFLSIWLLIVTSMAVYLSRTKQWCCCCLFCYGKLLDYAWIALLFFKCSLYSGFHTYNTHIVLLQHLWKSICYWVLVLCFWMEQVLFNGTAYIGQISLGLYVVYLTMIILLSHWFVAIFTSLPIGTLVLISFVLTSCMSIALDELLSRNRITAKLLLGKYENRKHNWWSW